MFLTASNLAQYLVTRGLITAESIVDGDFTVLEAGRRNRNFKVLQRSGSGLFVKQIKELGESAQDCIKREANCYRLAQQYPEWAALMPGLIAHDEIRHCLMSTLLPQSENLREYHDHHAQFPLVIGDMLGRALASYHRCLTHPDLLPQTPALFVQKLPWVLAWHTHPFSALSTAKKGTHDLWRAIRAMPDLPRHLERIAQNWRFDSIIHGDIKWDNCVVYPLSDGTLKVNIVDWELVDFGDASWDVGGAFQSYLSHSIMRTRNQPNDDVTQLMAQAMAKMPEMFGAIDAFWTAYRTTRAISASDDRAYLLRCIEHAAARLVQTAFESLSDAEAITVQASALLRLSENILNDPAQAATQLLGFSAEL